MTISHHLDDATLMSFAAGSLPEPLTAVAATHLDMCSKCTAEVRRLERIGSAMVETLAPTKVSGAAPRVSELDGRIAPEGLRVAARQREMGRAIADLVANLDTVPWKRFALGLWHLPLPLSAGVVGDLRLLKVAPGNALPDHGHGGSELTIVLRGSYHDKIGCFRAGDVADLDDSVEHTPIADAEAGCICLIASDRRARFKGLIARAIQPFTRY